MAEANESRRRAMESLSLQIGKYPRDLLQRFKSSNTQQSEEATTPSEDLDETELNLGLSLGGRFGVDKSSKKLIRSSSVAGTIPVVRDDQSLKPTLISYPTLIRTSSLPTETEEEWRKRKELQTLRRMAAKRRRSEKQRSSKAEKEEERKEIEANLVLNLRDNQLKSQGSVARQAVLGDIMAMYGQHKAQGSAESQGGSSSGMSELESKLLQGSSSCGEARSTGSDQSLQERSNQEAVGSSGTKTTENACRTSRVEMENPSKKPDSAEKEMNMLEDMPCVFTKGDGPNGRRIEGILYKYGKGEDVRIMCVCHGNFLSPAEFVKHAGGGDVDHPLRHIVVNPSPTPFL